jgi:hypothetical protein
LRQNAPAVRFGAHPVRLADQAGAWRKPGGASSAPGHIPAPCHRAGDESARARSCACPRSHGPMAPALKLSRTAANRLSSRARPSAIAARVSRGPRRWGSQCAIGPRGHAAEDERILPGQRLAVALSVGNSPPCQQSPPCGQHRPGRVCGSSGRRLLLYFAAVLRGPGVRIILLTCGAKGTRTPDPLLANRRQHVHWCPSPQVTVLGRAPASVQIRAGCCTFPLYSPAGSAAVQERVGTACRVSRFPPSAARRTGGLRRPVTDLILPFCRDECACKSG